MRETITETGAKKSTVKYTGRNKSGWSEYRVDLDGVPWDHLIRLAHEPCDGDYKGVRQGAGEVTEGVLRQFSNPKKASGMDLGRLLAAYLMTTLEETWEVYYEAEQQGYFHEVSDVAFTSDHPPDSESAEADAIKW